MKNDYKFRCKICEKTMVKAGKSDNGKQRYKCSGCNTRTLVKNEPKRRQNELKMFVKWIIDSTKATDKINMPRRTFYRKTNWCWDVVPTIKPDGIPSGFIIIDATYLNKNLCLLIARNEEYVLGFKWAKSECFEEYYELLKPLKEPSFVICDGHSGITKAVERLWKNAGVQRCLVHIVQHAERKLGKRSPCEENHIFRKHIGKITSVDTVRKSKNWLKKFDSLYEIHRDFIEEETPRIDVETGEVFGFYKAHPKLFSVCNMIKKLRRKNMLFLFLEAGIPNNSNYLEGGINSPLKNLMRCHRGFVLEHQKRMFEWYLLSRSATSVNDVIKQLDFDVLYPENGN